MINPSELMLGNWVIDGEGYLGKVVVIGNWNTVKYNVGSFKTWTGKELNPVPISPAILEAAGFSNQHGEGDAFWLSIALKDDISLINIQDGGLKLMCKGIEIEYVHELQNTYLWRTKTPLTINEKVFDLSEVK